MFWERLYSTCLQKGYKPNTLAKAIGLSSATATKWKNGAIPNGEALIKIADYLDCSVDYLLGRTDNPDIQKTALSESESGKNTLHLVARNGKQLRMSLTDDQYKMLYTMFSSLPDADNPRL